MLGALNVAVKPPLIVFRTTVATSGAPFACKRKWYSIKTLLPEV